MGERLFGTNGIRRVVGEELTAPFVTQVAEAIAATVPPGAPIVVGWDGRTSSVPFARIVGASLALAGHHVIEVGLLPTPAVQFSVRRLGAQLGVIVTASHNPPEFNGLKCIAADGLEVPRSVEEAIETGVERRVTAVAPYPKVGTISSDAHGASHYLDGILAQVDVARVRERRFSVVLDCGNGASVVTSPTLLRRLGCRTVTLNGHVDGTFPGHLSEPTEANLSDLLKVVPASGADLGIAHDGDADRAVFVEASGRFVPGEEMLTLLARDAVERHPGGLVVSPVSASQAVEDAIRPFGGRVLYTRVGSPSVTHAMQEHSAVFGGEENGGLIFPAFQLARDGAMTAAMVLDLLARQGGSLTDLLATIPRYTMVKEKTACPVALREPVLSAVRAALEPGSAGIETIDGLKVRFADGWLLLRPSGTEPLFRVFAESKDPARARALADRGLAAVRSALEHVGSVA
ncbi:MAG TPA: phosphoglucosamine mutase [Thermoplasmata archaeon]|nr:phosphoglucosamine mutase [Thermoplasmata archaeon]